MVLLFEFLFFLRFANKLDNWFHRRQISRFHRRNPEPTFNFIEPVWSDEDDRAEEPPDFACDDALFSARRILGVDETTSLEGVKKAYRAKVKNCHPDKVSHLGADVRAVAEGHTKALNEAYSTILAAG
jgi:DnaJ-domain-containing protein 1